MLQGILQRLLRAIIPFREGAPVNPAFDGKVSRHEIAAEHVQASATLLNAPMDLSPEEHQKVAERRRQYERFAQRMGLVEIEEEADEQRQ